MKFFFFFFFKVDKAKSELHSMHVQSLVSVPEIAFFEGPRLLSLNVSFLNRWRKPYEIINNTNSTCSLHFGHVMAAL